MRNLIVLGMAFAVAGCVSSEPVSNGECRSFPQKVVVGNRYVDGTAVGCPDGHGRWHVTSFKDALGNDLPVPSEILYPQPDIIQTRPKTVFTPGQPVNNMPLPDVTFYQQ